MKVFLRLHITLILILLVSAASFAQVNNERKTHVVKSNETLFSIAQEYNLSVRDLKKWNHLKNNTIKIGEKLFVTPPEHFGKPANTKKAQSTKSQNFLNQDTPGRTTYKVKRGDNLYKIARRFNMTISQIKRLNHLKSNQLRVGQKLLLKAPISAPSVSVASKKNMSSTPQGKFIEYKVKRRESLATVLKKYQMDKSEFEALNPNFSGSRLYAGQHITLLLPPTVVHKNPYLENGNASNAGGIKAVMYNKSKIGTPTTNGDLYNPDALTAASSSLPLGTIAYVVNINTHKGLYVLITDRTTGNELKLSRKAYHDLGLTSLHSEVKILNTNQ